MELDALTAADNATIAGDTCIVGAGPMGLTLANALAAAGRDVVLIESGTSAHDDDADQLNAGDLHGDLGPDLRHLRARAVGGTATIWNTFLDGAPCARFVPLDAGDFAPRAWRDGTGWPIPFAAVESYYPRANAACGLGPYQFGAAMSGPAHPAPPVAGSALRCGVYQVGSVSKFASELPAAMRGAPRVMLVRGATATGISMSSDRSRVTALSWTTLNGRHGTVRASRFVLAAGGIENARLLLLWSEALAMRACPWLGRGFMQHPWESSLEIVSKLAPFAESNGFFAPHRNAEGVGIMGRIALTPQLVAGEEIGNAGIYVVPRDQPRLLVQDAARAAARRVVPARRVRRSIGNAIRSAAALAWRTRGRPCVVEIYLEQAPHFDNRVALSTRRDRFGQPMASVHWRFTADDEANRVRVRDVVCRELERAGLGRVRRRRGGAVEHENHHHVGATRMHPDPELGVVDTDQRVHGQENLYVAGASVFPTGGFANPTLSALALTLRLADHLTAS